MVMHIGRNLAEQKHRSQPAMSGEFLSEILSVNTAIAGGWVQTFALLSSSHMSSQCFVIMPFTDPDGYKTGHFREVYEQIFKPACEMANLQPFRADDVTKSDVIHASMLNALALSDMVLCDLSTLNANVMYELGIRQAFGLPFVLVQEQGTRRIFDLGPIRVHEYDPILSYSSVRADQSRLAEFLKQSSDTSSLLDLLDNAAKKRIQHELATPEELRSIISAIHANVTSLAASRTPQGSEVLITREDVDYLNRLLEEVERIEKEYGQPMLEPLEALRCGVDTRLGDRYQVLEELMRSLECELTEHRRLVIFNGNAGP